MGFGRLLVSVRARRGVPGAEQTSRAVGLGAEVLVGGPSQAGRQFHGGRGAVRARVTVTPGRHASPGFGRV